MIVLCHVVAMDCVGFSFCWLVNVEKPPWYMEKPAKWYECSRFPLVATWSAARHSDRCDTPCVVFGVGFRPRNTLSVPVFSSVQSFMSSRTKIKSLTFLDLILVIQRHWTPCDRGMAHFRFIGGHRESIPIPLSYLLLRRCLCISRRGIPLGYGS